MDPLKSINNKDIESSFYSMMRAPRGGKGGGRGRKAPAVPASRGGRKTARRGWKHQSYNRASSFARARANESNFGPTPHPGQAGVEEEEKDQAHESEVEDDDDEMGVKETFSAYQPSKLTFGKPHPDEVVETASMASVLPPDIKYRLKLPQDIISKGKLSALQLEAVVYACQQHGHFLRNGERAGFLIGDGAGVGKGRTIAGIILENFIQGRKKAIWVSVSPDLKFDCERDLEDIGASHIQVFALNKLKYGQIQLLSENEGVIFSTYSGLIGHSTQNGKRRSRLQQIINWCGRDFDGVVVFDESHRAKNLCPAGAKSKPTKTGAAVQELQKQLPKARVVYASATGASEPKNMAYMSRLGIWGPATPFREFKEFIDAVEKRGIGAMEIVAMEMKLRGAYIARQLSFRGVTFGIEKVPSEPKFIQAYDDSAALWVEAVEIFTECATRMKLQGRTGHMMWAQFWGAHQRFFKYLCIASKVKHACEVALEAVKSGKCVVIGLQSTGEARTLEQLNNDEGELTDFVCTAKAVLETLVQKHFPDITKHRFVAEYIKSGGILKKLYPSLSLDDGLKNKSELPNPSKSEGVKRKSRTSAGRAFTGFSAKSSGVSSKRMKFDGFDTDSDDSEWTPEESGLSNDNDKWELPDIDSGESETDYEDFDLMFDPETKTKPKKTERTEVPEKELWEKHCLPKPQDVEEVYAKKRSLLKKIENLGERLPPNTLDELIDKLGGPKAVAEMTGRKGRVVQNGGAKIKYESRADDDQSLETINLAEKHRFMAGRKKIAIISEAASCGISLQSDKRVQNKDQRVHITLELPWSADRAIQQFGRTHRSNQANAPQYVLIISDFAGEYRFASIVAKRLESLGALTHGDRRATETRDLSRFHVDNKYGTESLTTLIEYVIRGYTLGSLPEPKTFDFRNKVGTALAGVGLVHKDKFGYFHYIDKPKTNIPRFLNRILGMPVQAQNDCFKYFTDTLSHLVALAKKSGRFDLGILDVGDSRSGDMEVLKLASFMRKHATGLGEVVLHKLIVERGMSWEESLDKFTASTGEHDGYYLANQTKCDKKAVIYVEYDPAARAGGWIDRIYSVYRPNTGLQYRRDTLEEIENSYFSVTPERAEAHWKLQFDAAKTVCTHAFWSGNCKNMIIGNGCDVGLRTRAYHVLSGNVLIAWDQVARVISQQKSYFNKRKQSKIQIIRAHSGDFRVVGLLIPSECVNSLCKLLEEYDDKESQDVAGMNNPVESDEDSSATDFSGYGNSE